ncbi:transglycosylase SLT domain-containing protein [Streptomyces albus]|uniref:transglycosylase SLT domain-containing protein n=1 Tax=Streptomyces albus TaxID=1888 RepID=UPI0036FB10FB
MRTTTLIPRRIATTGITVLGAAGIATAALTGTAHAQAPAKPAHQATAQAAAKPAKADDKADKKAEKKDTGKKAEDYPDNLDGWIREAMSIMKKHGIPGSYDGIKRNIIRESGGDPNAVNDWDINAQKGIPSKGLLQVIQPTFDQYHVKGTADKLTDPVANIVAACNYAADRYGTMDNVDSAY